MKAYLTKSILTVIISLIFILPATGMNFGLAPAHADSVCPQQGMSKDSQRLAQYKQVIRDYLKEVIATLDNVINNKQEYAKEYIVWLCSPSYLGDFIPLEGGALSEKYSKFRNALVKIDKDFGDKYREPLGDIGELVYDINGHLDFLGWSAFFDPKLLRFEKTADSPYPKVLISGSYQRDSAAQKAAKDYAAGLRERNDKIVKALRTYLNDALHYTEKDLGLVHIVIKSTGSLSLEAYEMIESFIEDIGSESHLSPKDNKDLIAWSALQRWIDSFLPRDTYTLKDPFILVKVMARFAYNAEKKFSRFKIETAQKNMELRNELYKLNEDYANELYDSWTQGKTNIRRTNWFNGVDDEGAVFCTVCGSIGIYPWGWAGGFDTEAFRNRRDRAGRLVYNEDQANYMKGIYDEVNRLYNGFKPAQEKLGNTLKTIITKYKVYFPQLTSTVFAELRSPPDEDPQVVYDYPSSYAGWNFGENFGPIAAAGIYAPKKMSEEGGKFSLSAKTASGRSGVDSNDPNGDPLYYRWVITKIPETEEAKSAKYVLYQRIAPSQIPKDVTSWSTSPEASFEPDLAGEWEVTLEARDWQAVSESKAIIRPQRHILWIQHSNGPYDPKTGLGIELSLYQPIDLNFDQPSEITRRPEGLGFQWGGPYYVEVSHEKAGIYLNYNDDGMPVDKDNSYDQTRPSFAMRRITEWRGAYSGYWGSTDLYKTRMMGLGDFSLISASGSPGFVTLSVEVKDPAVTELVLSSRDCLYGQYLGIAKSGSYAIEQCVDHYAWCNFDGCGFIRQGWPNGVPDWLERMAGETLNKFPEALPYVQRILKTDGEWEYGHYNRGTKYVFLYPYAMDIRYNLSATNIYGFTGLQTTSDTARHEGFHAYKFWVMRKHLVPDKDQDDLPGDNAGGMFEYAFDFGTNIYGGLGAIPDPPGSTFTPMLNMTGFKYIGDKYYDNDNYRNFMKVINKGNIDFMGGIIDLPIPANIPISETKVFLYLLGEHNGEKISVPLKNAGPFFTTQDKLSGQKTTTPKLTLTLRINETGWNQWVRMLERNGLVLDGNIYIWYYINSPKQMDEYDASRIEPGKYTGLWGKKD